MSVIASKTSLRLRRERVASHAPPGAVWAGIAERNGAFFLDSGGENRRLAQWSFLGDAPYRTLCGGLDGAFEITPAGRRFVQGNPFDLVAEGLAAHTIERTAHGLPPFVGGAVAFFGYDLRHLIERLPSAARRDCGIPDLFVSFHDSFLAYDHIAGEWQALVLEERSGRTPGGRRVRDEVARLCALIDGAKPAAEATSGKRYVGDVRSNFDRDEYLRAVSAAKEYIAAGDIFQVNLSQRFETELAVSPPALYEALRSVNPAPFAAYLKWDDWTVAGASPERFLLVRDGHVWTRPIKGTRKRTGDPTCDERLKRELLSSEKDQAELVMIVDLERNDLGRVCDYGSVHVTEPVVLEEHPTVYHLVATVEGVLHEGKTAVDLIKASFPGGSITGAPKVRAMEIIDELEPIARNLYTGAVGYLGFDGAMDLNIVIRTFLVEGRRATFQVGGGIVADSDAAAEYEETLHKGAALLDALGYKGDLRL